MLEVEAGGEVRKGGGGTTSSDRLRRPPSPKWEGKRETILTAFEAAEIIRVAFGKEGWRWKARGRYTAAQVVAALWVAQRESGNEVLGELIRWAGRML